MAQKLEKHWTALSSDSESLSHVTERIVRASASFKVLMLVMPNEQKQLPNECAPSQAYGNVMEEIRRARGDLSNETLL